MSNLHNPQPFPNQADREAEILGEHGLPDGSILEEIGAEQIRQLGPANLSQFWSLHLEFAGIPHGSRHEGPLRDHIMEMAGRQNFECAVDDFGNLAIRVPGKGKGADSTDGVILQSHLDAYAGDGPDAKERATRAIVPFLCQQEIKDSFQDYGKCWVMKGHGTSGIGDNLVGVAMQSAITLTDAVPDHPPIIALFTVQEEPGLYGAKALDPALIADRDDGVTYNALLNLDSGRPNAIRIGSAAGKAYNFHWDLQREKTEEDDVLITLRVSGLKGGHSGLEIDRPHANAIKVLLSAVSEQRLEPYDLRLSTISGGTGNGAIPQEAEISFWCHGDVAETVEQLLTGADVWKRCQNEMEETDVLPTVTRRVGTADDLAPMSIDDTQRILGAMNQIHHGPVESYRPLETMPEMPLLSNNLAKVVTMANGESIRLQIQSRSFEAERMSRFQETLVSKLEESGATAQATLNYAACPPNPDNPLIDIATPILAQHFGFTPEIIAQHSGLEIGELQAKKPGLSIMSMGPKIGDHHKLSEYLVISTVPPTYRSVVDILKAFCD